MPLLLRNGWMEKSFCLNPGLIGSGVDSRNGQNENTSAFLVLGLASLNRGCRQSRAGVSPARVGEVGALLVFAINRGQGAQKHGSSSSDPFDKPAWNHWLGTCFVVAFYVSRFFSRNLEFRGRLVRGVLGGLFLIAGIIVADFNLWVCLPMVAFGLFAIFEAVSGWCLVRACGIRTKL